MNVLYLGAALSLGLVTSLHCVGMCGPLALALPVVGGTRAAYAAGRLFYNLGRAVTYTALGALVGLVGQAFALGGLQRWISITVGAAILIGLVLVQSGAMNRMMESLGVWSMFARLQQLWRRRFQGRGFSGLFVLGLINGLLPCGPVYVALAGAAATGTVADASLFMLVFGMGTLPMMLAVSMAGKLVQLPLRRRLQRLVPASAAAVALLLILRGMALGIPFLSPPVQATTLHDGQPACCHGHK